MKKLNTLILAILLSLFSTSAWVAEDHNQPQQHKDARDGENKHDEEHEHGSEDKQEDEHGHGSENNKEDEHGHGSENKQGDEHAEGAVELNPLQRQTAQIVVTEIKFNSVPEEIRAPGEVVANAYRSTKVTPRIDAQVVKRHARLGQHVRQGQVLVTLSSVDMAEAQGQLLVSDREWKRVKKLGRKVVSERRYIEAQVAYQQAYAKVIAYGMTKTQIESLLKQQDASKATGEFELLAAQNGTVIKDEFIVGEIIEPGRILFVITDENQLWVEARLTPEDGSKIETGAVARVLAGKTWLQGKVVQAHHTLDESTRTLAVVIEVPNEDDKLHPGLFVDTFILSSKQSEAITIPEKATIRSTDGDWVVFVELEAGHYKPMEVKIIRTVNDTVVVEGIEPGTRIVTQGVFFLQSELAKSGFDIHNH